MSENKISIEEVAREVTSDGIGYAIECRVSWKNIEDPHLAGLWKRAEEVIEEIERILDEYEAKMGSF